MTSTPETTPIRRSARLSEKKTLMKPSITEGKEEEKEGGIVLTPLMEVATTPPFLSETTITEREGAIPREEPSSSSATRAFQRASSVPRTHTLRSDLQRRNKSSFAFNVFSSSAVETSNKPPGEMNSNSDAKEAGSRPGAHHFTTVRSTKPLTIPVTPLSTLTLRRGPKLYSNMGSEEPNHSNQPHVKTGENKEVKEPLNARRGLTQVRPFHFRIDQRIPLPPPPHLPARELQDMTMNTSSLHAYRGTVTVPLSPHLRTQARAEASQRARPESQKQRDEAEMSAVHAFRALPLPPSQPNAVGATEQRLPFQPTVPTSPNFELPKRSRSRAASAPPRRAIASSQDAAKPVAAAIQGPRPLTEPQSPMLESIRRSQQARAMREQLQHMRLEEEKRLRNGVAVAAVPDFSHPFVPQHSSKHLTEFKTFELVSVSKHAEAQKARQAAIKAAEEAVASLRNFRPRTVPQSLHEAPPQAKRSSRPPLVPEDVKLHSEERALLRRDFDVEMTQRLRDKAVLKEAAAQAEDDKENEALNALRHLPIEQGGYKFVPAPVLTEDPFPVRTVAVRKLTEPESPHLLIDRRMLRKSTN